MTRPVKYAWSLLSPTVTLSSRPLCPYRALPRGRRWRGTSETIWCVGVHGSLLKHTFTSHPVRPDSHSRYGQGNPSEVGVSLRPRPDPRGVVCLPYWSRGSRPRVTGPTPTTYWVRETPPTRWAVPGGLEGTKGSRWVSGSGEFRGCRGEGDSRVSKGFQGIRRPPGGSEESGGSGFSRRSLGSSGRVRGVARGPGGSKESGRISGCSRGSSGFKGSEGFRDTPGVLGVWRDVGVGRYSGTVVDGEDPTGPTSGVPT